MNIEGSCHVEDIASSHVREPAFAMELSTQSSHFSRAIQQSDAKLKLLSKASLQCQQ